jgi:hypothetical protein
MVNPPLPRTVAKSLQATRQANSPRRCCIFVVPKMPQQTRPRAFAKILAKLYFFQLFENLRRILFDYAQKRSGRANATFNAAC